MKINLDPGKRPVKVKVQRYPGGQRAFLKEYLEKLVETGYLKPNSDATWQAAHLCVSKSQSKAKFRLTVDLKRCGRDHGDIK